MGARGKSSNGKRLIDANVLLLKLKKSHDLFVDAWEGFSNLPEEDKARVDEITHCIAEVMNAPAVDAVIPVRCAQCKHFKRNLENDTYCSSVNGLTDPQEDDFCSYGERKSDDDQA